MPIGLRSTRPRKSSACVKLSTDPESALPNARAVLRMAAGDGLDCATLARMLELPEDAVRAAADWLGPSDFTD